MKITKILFVIFCILAFLVALVSAITMGIHQVTKKDNMVKIADAYLTSQLTVKESDVTGKKDQDSKEQPGEEQPGEEQPGEEQPGEEQPGEEQPGEEQPGEEQPGEEQPSEEQPGEEQQGSDIPVLGETLSEIGLDTSSFSSDKIGGVIDGFSSMFGESFDLGSLSQELGLNIDSSVLEQLGKGDFSDIVDLSGNALLQGLTMEGGPFSAFIDEGMVNKISGFIALFNTLKEVFNGNEGVVSLLLGMVGTGKYINSEIVTRALAAESLRKYPQLHEISDNSVNLFVHSRLMTYISIEYAFVYYDYLADAKTLDNWESRYASGITDLMMDRLLDFSLLLGRPVTAEDAEFLSDFVNVLGGELVSEVTDPKEKFASYSPTAVMFLRLMFSPSIYIAQFVILLICAIAVAVFMNSWRRGCAFFGGITLSSGAILLVLYFFNLWDTMMLGNKILAERKESILAAQVFLIIGIVMTAIGVILVVLQALKFEAFQPKARPASPEVAEMSQNVLTVDEIALMTKMNMTDIIQNSLKKHKDGEFVDYYGDGRGKALFDAYSQYKASYAQNPGDPSQSGTPAPASAETADAPQTEPASPSDAGTAPIADSVPASAEAASTDTEA